MKWPSAQCRTDDEDVACSDINIEKNYVKHVSNHLFFFGKEKVWRFVVLIRRSIKMRHSKIKKLSLSAQLPQISWEYRHLIHTKSSTVLAVIGALVMLQSHFSDVQHHCSYYYPYSEAHQFQVCNRGHYHFPFIVAKSKRVYQVWRQTVKDKQQL